MSKLSMIACLLMLLISTGVFGITETKTFSVTNTRHLKYENYASSGDSNLKVGGYPRSETGGYSNEILLKPDLTTILGADIHNVTLRFYVSEIYTPHNEYKVNLYEQDKMDGVDVSTAEYLTFPEDAWSNSLGEVAIGFNANPQWYEISSTSLKSVVQDWVNGTKQNDGFVLGGGAPPAWMYYWAVSQIEIVVDYTLNSKPIAVNVSVSGDAVLGKTLTGHYNYYDGDNDPEGATTVQWYRGADATGQFATALSGETSNSYEIKSQDVEMYLAYSVTPVATSGKTPGAEYKSAWFGPIKNELDGTDLTITQGHGDWIKLKRTKGSGYWRVHNPESQDRMEFGYRTDADVDMWGLLNIHDNGALSVGTTDKPDLSDARLVVDGSIRATSFKVGSWVIKDAPDYVFDKSYNLRTLEELDSILNKNKHLPEIPSAKEIRENGLDLTEMNMLLLKKIEELTLYTIEQQNEIKSLRKDVESLQAETIK